eukprot:TRINITY_DN29488_c0_g1_i1.p1 TRINITY_DN29488_c0_g1~~TRINITY_DN29488_c0_g1_i1.p1  ORF type:complete len:623 (+),score=76.57 TRINITY_DN29488_c0_g1_i1:52-1869(+)
MATNVRLFLAFFSLCLSVYSGVTADDISMEEVKGASAAEAVDPANTNILLLSASLSGHLIPTLSLGQELKDRGYKVYLAAPYVSEKMPGRIIDGTEIIYIATGGAPESESEVSKRNTARWSTRTVSTFTMMIRARSEFYSNDGLQLYSMLSANMIREDGLHFVDTSGSSVVMKPDLVLANHFTSVQTGEHIAQKYNVPLLFNSPQLIWDPMPAPPFFFPIHSAPRGLTEMTFYDRMYSVLWYKLDGHYWAHHFAYQLATTKLQQKCKCNQTITEYPEPGVIRPKLVNTVVGFDYALPTPPMVIYTGPLIYPPPGRVVAGPSPLEAKPELLQWLEQWGDRRVTVVSMGSHARLNVKQGTALLQGLLGSGRPILWSLRKDNREFLPADMTTDPHLRMEEWLPQRAVLAHRAVQIFVGHCGFGGTHESLYFGVPMVCIPVMADQPELAVRLRASGAGVSLNVDTMTADDVQKALNKLGGPVVQEAQKEDQPGVPSGGIGSMIGSPAPPLTEYALQAKQLGKLMRLEGGVKKGAEVVAYLLQTKSSEHWIMPDVNMPFVLRYNIDVYGAYAGIVLAAYVVVRLLLWALFELLVLPFGGKKSSAKKKKSE